MKKVISILTCLTALAGALNAQQFNKAIGLRLGYDAQEFSYQQSLGDTHRLELTFGVNTFGYNQAGKLCRGAGFNGIYQWVNDLSTLSAGVKWYLGLGAAVLDHGSLSAGKYGAGAMGQIGVEYNFDSTWLLSLDYRPGFYWLPGSGNIYRFSWNTPCLAIRYHL